MPAVPGGVHAMRTKARHLVSAWRLWTAIQICPPGCQQTLPTHGYLVTPGAGGGGHRRGRRRPQPAPSGYAEPTGRAGIWGASGTTSNGSLARHCEAAALPLDRTTNQKPTPPATQTERRRREVWCRCPLVGPPQIMTRGEVGLTRTGPTSWDCGDGAQPVRLAPTAPPVPRR